MVLSNRCFNHAILLGIMIKRMSGQMTLYS